MKYLFNTPKEERKFNTPKVERKFNIFKAENKDGVDWIITSLFPYPHDSRCLY